MAETMSQPQSNDLLSIVCNALAPFNEEGLLLNEGTDIVADLGVDSPAILELIFNLEEEFDISIPINALADITTIGELCALIEGEIKQSKVVSH